MHPFIYIYIYIYIYVYIYVYILIHTYTHTYICILIHTHTYSYIIKGVNLPGVAVDLPAMCEKDKHDIKWGISNDVDYIAASFIRKKSDILEIKEYVASLMKEYHTPNHPPPMIISKVENTEALTNFDEILEVNFLLVKYIYFTSLYFTLPHFTLLHFSSLYFTLLHFASLHFTSIHFTLLHFTS